MLLWHVQLLLLVTPLDQSTSEGMHPGNKQSLAAACDFRDVDAVSGHSDSLLGFQSRRHGKKVDVASILSSDEHTRAVNHHSMSVHVQGGTFKVS